MKFSDKTIDNLKPKDQRYEVWEGGTGLGIRVSKKHKTWIHKFRYERKQEWLTLGRYPGMSVAGAHEAFAANLTLLEKGINPKTVAQQRREEERRSPTIEGLMDEYLEKWARPRKRSWKEDQRILEKDVIPAWGIRKVCDINRRDVIILLDEIVDRGAPIIANRTFAVIRKMFNFAVSRDIIPSSPCFMVKAPAKENRRARVLSREEIKTIWEKLTTPATEQVQEEGKALKMTDATKQALMLLLLTAQRPIEVVSAKWSQFDLTDQSWTLPAEKTKNGHPHRVPLSSLVIEFLKEWQEKSSGNPFLFPSPKADHHITRDALGHAVRKNLYVLGTEPWVPHDLRRTAASNMTREGIPRLVVSKLLNHADKSVTAVYDCHSYDKQKRFALNTWAQLLKKIISGEESMNVTNITHTSRPNVGKEHERAIRTF